MIHQFIHFFVIWILSFQHLSSPVTCSFGQLWGCCQFLGYSLWYVVDQWHCVYLLPIYSTINSWILFLDYQWHMSGEQPEPVQFLGNFVHHTDTNMLAKGIWNYMHSNTNTLSKGICICMRIIVFGGMGRQRERFRSSEGLAKEKKEYRFSFRFSSSQPWIFKLIVWRALVRLTLEFQQWSDESDLASKHCQHFP